jgi:hypothetical protein
VTLQTLHYLAAYLLHILVVYSHSKEVKLSLKNYVDVYISRRQYTAPFDIGI